MMDWKITSNNEEVCHILSGINVKSEFVEAERSCESFKYELKEIANDANAEINILGSQDNSVLESQKTNLLTDSDVKIKIKKENEDKSGIIHELVGYFPGDTESHKEVKFENSIKDENCLDACVENHFGEDASLLPVDDSSTTSQADKKSFDVRSEVRYDSSSIKLVDVSVRLKDLFPSNLRKLGKVHLNMRSCSCIYCRGEYRYTYNSQHLFEDPQVEKQSPEAKLYPKIQQNFEPKIQQTFQKGPFKCKQCGAEFKRHSSLNTHLIAHSDDRPFECEQCPAKFKTSHNLNGHLKIHSNERPFECHQCSAKFKSNSHLKVHLSVHSNDRPFGCKICRARFKQRFVLNVHVSKVHSDEKPFKCGKCSATFKYRNRLNIHLMVHNNEKALECGHSIEKSRTELLKHDAKESCELTARSAQCSAQVHSKDERRLECEHCSAKFKNKNHLANHLKKHRLRLRIYKCAQCPEAFKTTRYLRRHLKVVHSDERPFKCELCPAKFKTKGTLKGHLSTHSIPLECKLCRVKFKRSYLMKFHFRSIHGDEKPFKCEQCPAMYQHRFELNTHLAVHRGDKPFACSLCYQKFNRNSHLNRHLGLHSDKNLLYKCEH